MWRVFISHSSADNRQARALMRWLETTEPGLAGEIFLDVDQDTGIATGQRWTQALWQANARCEAVVCLLSENWAKSPECRAEFRQAEGMGKPILCARIEQFDPPDFTRGWQSCDLFGEGPATAVAIDDGAAPVRMLDDGLQRLRIGLRTVGIGADTFPWPPPDDPRRSPYRGWQPLESVDAAVYFGRDAQIVRALDELAEMHRSGQERMFVILGASGVGKSSFLRAGLLPRLCRDDGRFLTMPILRPERRALTGESGLARSIHQLRADVGLTQPILGDIKNAIADPQRVRAWLAEAVTAFRQPIGDDAESSAGPTLVLPIDQAEELFGSDAGVEAQQFLTLLAALLTEPGSPTLDLLTIVTIRSDRYEPLQLAGQLSAVQSHLFDRLRPLPSAQFAEVIRGPARRAGESGSTFTLSPELVDRLADDASQGADTLPLLALTLSRLYEDYAGSDAPVTVAHYEAMGGMRHVVQSEIDSVLSTDPAVRSTELERLRAAFIPWLATVDADTGKPMRRIARWAELPEDCHDLVNAFVARRLLVKGERNGHIVVEVAVESLLVQWDDLAGWLQAEAVDLRDTDTLERAAVAWERSGRHDDWLLDGERLSGAETLSAQTGFGERLRPASEFVLASRQRVNRKLETEKQAAEAHAKSLRRRSQILSLALVVVVVAGALAVFNLQRARKAEERAGQETIQAIAAKLVGRSRAMLGGTIVGGDRRALQQLAAAEALAPGSDPDSLLNTLVDERRLLNVIGVPNGSRIIQENALLNEYLTADADQTLHRWDLRTGREVGEPLVGHKGKVVTTTFSDDGRFIASGADDHTARIWDRRSSRQLAVINSDSGVVSMQFSRDGSVLAIGNKDGTVRLWSIAAGSMVGEPIRAHNGWVAGLRFTPDGRRLVSVGLDGAVHLWDPTTGKPAGPSIGSHVGAIAALDMSRDGHRIATTGQTVNAETGKNGTELRVTDIDTGRQVFGLTQYDYAALAAAFSPDGRHLAVGGLSDGTIHILDANTGAETESPLLTHGGMAFGDYSLDGSAITGVAEKAIFVWAADPDQSVGTRVPDPAKGWVVTAVSPDGKTVATKDPDGQSSILLSDAKTGKRLRTIPTGHPGPIDAVGWRADGTVIASANSADDSVRVHDVQSGAEIGPPFTGVSGIVSSLSLSPDGRFLAAAGLGGDVWLWDLAANSAAGRHLSTNSDMVSTVAFSADGHRVVAVSPIHSASDVGESGEINAMTSTHRWTASSVLVWDTATGAPAGPAVTGLGGRAGDLGMNGMGDHPAITAAAISPDGQRIVVGANSDLRVYDVASGKLRGEPWGVERPAIGVAYTSDGRYVVMADVMGQSTIRIMDAQTGRPIGSPLRPTATVRRLSVSPDDRTIVSGDDDGWMVWPGPAAWRDTLCDKLADSMTDDEWKQWVSDTIPKMPTCPDGAPG